MPDCDLRNPAAQNLTATGGDICQASNAQTFGTATQTTAAIDPKILSGWGVRSNDWQIGASVQQQVLPRVSVEVGYFRRWLNNFTVTDNLLVGSADYTAYSITAPSDPRLPGGGGYAVDGLYNVVPEQVRPDEQQHHARRRHRRPVSALQRDAAQREREARSGPAVPGRHQHRQDGPGQLRRARASAGVDHQPPGVSPAVNPGNPYCHSDPGFVTKLTALGSYTVPKIDVLLQRDVPQRPGGAALAANWNAPVALVSAALGRPAAVVGNTVPINLVAPGQVWGDRVNALDLRFAKILRFGRTRNTIGIDVYNVTNSNAILTYNQNFNPATTTGSQAWLAPLSVLTPRFLKIGAQIDF